MNWQQLDPKNIDAVIAWAESQPWARAMAQCQQDATWHAEGDVWTHTKLVLQELTRLDEWSELSADQMKALVMTALFHDVAKPETTVTDETGRVRSPKHAVKGEHVARQLLREMGCNLATRERIARLVRYHGRPVFLTEREEPINEVIRLSWLLNNRLLYLFSLADARGRDTGASDRPEENLHYWKLLAEEAACFDSPFAFETNHARFTYFRQQNPNLHYIPHENFRCRVTMMSGLPGTGKDTWIGKNLPGTTIVSLDEIRRDNGIDPTDNQGTVVQHAKEACRELLRAGEDFCFNATNLQKSTRGRWLDLFADYDAEIEIVYLEPPMETILQQNHKRIDSTGTNVELVPRQVIERLATRLEVPSELECHRLISVPAGLAMGR